MSYRRPVGEGYADAEVHGGFSRLTKMALRASRDAKRTVSRRECLRVCPNPPASPITGKITCRFYNHFVQGSCATADCIGMRDGGREPNAAARSRD